MNANKNLEAAIYAELYSAELDGITRYDANFDGYIFQGVAIEGDVITLTYDEVHSAEGLFHLIDGGVVTAEDTEYDAQELAEAANGAFDAVEDLAERNDEDEEKVRAIAGEGFSIAYKVNRAIDASVVTEFMTTRLAELAEEE